MDACIIQSRVWANVHLHARKLAIESNDPILLFYYFSFYVRFVFSIKIEKYFPSHRIIIATIRENLDLILRNI